MRDARPGVQQAEVIVDLGDRADGRSRVMRSAALVDGHRWREPFDIIHVGFVHLPQELPGIRRKGFDVTPLSFGKDRIESQ